MRNIQIVDRAENATFSIFQATEEEFARIFPGDGQDIEFPEDFFERVGDEVGEATLSAIWQRPILKRDAEGVHGTLYYGYADRRRHLPASKREVDLDEWSVNHAQRELFKRFR